MHFPAALAERKTLSPAPLAQRQVQPVTVPTQVQCASPFKSATPCNGKPPSPHHPGSLRCHSERWRPALFGCTPAILLGLAADSD
jgi:hypothetical protein